MCASVPFGDASQSRRQTAVGYTKEAVVTDARKYERVIVSTRDIQQTENGQRHGQAALQHGGVPRFKDVEVHHRVWKKDGVCPIGGMDE